MSKIYRGGTPHSSRPTHTAQHRRRRRKRRAARRLLALGVIAVLAVALIVGIPKLLAKVPAAAPAGSNAAASQAASVAGQAESTAPESAASEAPGSEAESVAQSETKTEAENFVCTWDTTGLDGFDYLLAVNRAANCVTVFTKDADGNYTVPYKAMVASGGDATPVGSYNTIENYRWRYLQGDVYGQYATRITGHILFHSVPYFSQNIDDLEYEEFNKLGTKASLGCIRLQVTDAKWIYDNCPIGTPTVLYDDAACPGPLGKPDFTHIDIQNETLRSWDPTDPDENNPWHNT